MSNKSRKKDIGEKLDVLDKLASSVVLAAIALFIKVDADDIAALKKDQMAQQSY